MVEASEDLSIEIRNCNSIDTARISLRRAALNIKYGPNGAGKSTIANALRLRAEGRDALEELLPFKHREVEGAPSPEVVGADSISKVLVFNDDYVAQFVFRPDEVLKDSFEVFINTDDYQQGLVHIEALLSGLKETFSQQPEFETALTSFIALRDAFGVTKSGALAKTSRGYKAIGMGSKLANIPEPLMGYKQFLEGDNPAEWITWQSKGKAYLELSDHCPFCASKGVSKETARQVSETYESAAVKNLSSLRHVIDDVGDYFEQGKLEYLRMLLTSVGDLLPEQATFLANMRTQVETFLGKLTALRSLSFQTLRDTDTNTVGDVLLSLRIDLRALDALSSAKTKSVVDLINGRLDEVAARLDDLRAQIGKQKGRVASLIKGNEAAVNDFLRSAGYRYSVKIEPTDVSYRMIVEHEDSSGHIEAANRHLSYGEKNAFALILFMHHVRKEKPDLVVLDDPVSSFDKTKKFAILHQLFHGPSSIRRYTTLLLTHDIEPAIDIVLNPTSGQFDVSQPIAHFLRSNSGEVSEKQIEPSHIATFSRVCEDNIQNSSDDVIKSIYLRRLYEAHGHRGVEYDILSSLLHVRDTVARKGPDGTVIPLAPESLEVGMDSIREKIPGFDYASTIRDLRDAGVVKAKFDATDVGYEKVQLFRILLAEGSQIRIDDKAFQKFVNESYHIENEYVMQLNPRQFDAVPEHVVHKCRELIDKAAA